MRTSELQFSEPAPFYKTYIDELGEVELLDMFQRQLKNFPEFMANIPGDKLHYAYVEGKWTVAGVLLHIIDAERVFQYRALRFSRGDRTPLAGFDQDVFISGADTGKRSMESIVEEYKALRRATITLFENLDQKQLERTGLASGMEWSVAKLGFVICGHQKHHRNSIRERYL